MTAQAHRIARARTPITEVRAHPPAIAGTTFAEDPDALPHEPVFALEVLLILGIILAGLGLLSILNWVGPLLFQGW